MGQDLVMVCNRCKTITTFLCRFANINKEDVQEYFFNHKGHEIRDIGDDGGWDLRISELMDDGYELDHFAKGEKKE